MLLNIQNSLDKCFCQELVLISLNLKSAEFLGIQQALIIIFVFGIIIGQYAQ